MSAFDGVWDGFREPDEPEALATGSARCAADTSSVANQ